MMNSKQKKLIILDFDWTIFDPSVVTTAMAEALPTLGLERALYFETYPIVRREGAGYIDVREHAHYIVEHYAPTGCDEFYVKLLAAWNDAIDRSAPAALHGVEFAKLVAEMRDEYVIKVLSYGETAFQDRKIRASGLYAIIPEEQVEIVEIELRKQLLLEGYLTAFEEVVFINDSAEHNDAIAQQFEIAVRTGILKILEMQSGFLPEDRKRTMPNADITLIRDLGPETIGLIRPAHGFEGDLYRDR